MMASGNCFCAEYWSPCATLLRLRAFGSPAHATSPSDSRIIRGRSEAEPLRIMPAVNARGDPSESGAQECFRRKGALELELYCAKGSENSFPAGLKISLWY